MKNSCRVIAILFTVAPILAYAQSKGAIKQAIEAKYTPAQPNDDRTDLAAAGSVIVLLKDDLALETTAQWTDTQGNTRHAIESTSTYKGGKFQRAGLVKFLTAGSHEHILVSGEKCWLIGVDVKDDGAVLEFMSDPINGARFKGFVKYPFPKGEVPAADAILQQIGETIKAEAMQASAAPQPAAAPMAAIPPPPPPADTPPPTLEKGQSKDQVVAAFGTPQKVVKIGTKEIDYYKDMKVTYVAGKVANVE